MIDLIHYLGKERTEEKIMTEKDSNTEWYDCLYDSDPHTFRRKGYQRSAASYTPLDDIVPEKKAKIFKEKTEDIHRKHRGENK